MNDNHLFDELQRSKQELTRAYEATIEAWVRALDMRDRDAAGHSLRVTELTLRLAHEMGIGDDQLVHFRRGALLHDIGMIGIPDAILFKPGTLTQQEWNVMRQHPGLGYSLLSPIAFLKPALDIVYCHHERWDGSGYPRGLKGEEIPLAARICAVVDVWDALLTEKPYRRSWQAESVILYFQDQAGKTLDPQVVKTFLTLVHD
jgi:putative nucleotidyltransferase with HDIG domain